MRNPLIEIPYYKGIIEAKDYSNDSYISPTKGGTVGLKLDQNGKFYSAFTNSNSNYYNYTKALGGTYSIAVLVKANTLNASRYIIDSDTAGSIYISNTNVVTASSGTVYVDNNATTTGISNKYISIIVSGITLTTNILYLLHKKDNTLNLNGSIAYFAIYSGALNESERNEIQNKFNNLSLPQSSVTLSETRPVVNFDLNIAGNNYITVADNDSLDFGTGSFSIYWEDSYPQRQSGAFAWIIAKDNYTTDGFSLGQNNLTTNSINYFERPVGGVGTRNIISNIPNGNHKFLFIRDISTKYLYLYCNGSLVYSFNYTNSVNLSTSTDLFIARNVSNKKSGNFKNLKIWKGQAVTWAQATQGFKTGLVLDLPLDEGVGTTVFDRSGLGNNGTITASAAYANKEWIVKQFDKGIIKYDFKDLNCDGNSILPKGWIKPNTGGGTFKGVTFYKQPGEICLNGDFSQGSGNTFTNWINTVGGTGSIVETLNGGVSGSRCPVITIDSGNSLSQIAQSTLTIGKVYKVQFYAKATGGSWIIGNDNSNGSIVITPTSSYILYSGYVTALTINFIIKRLSAASQTLWIDNVSITEVDPLPNFSNSTKYLECTSSGLVAFQNKQAYGQFNQILYKGADANVLDWHLITDKISTGKNGYLVRFGSDEKIYLYKVTNDVLAVLITSASTYSLSTYYDIKVTRSIAGLFTLYVNNVSIGIVTDTTFTTSNFNVYDPDTNDRLQRYYWKSVI